VNQSLLERRYRVIGKGAPLIVNEAGTMQSVCVAGLRRLPARSPCLSRECSVSTRRAKVDCPLPQPIVTPEGAQRKTGRNIAAATR